VGFVAIAGKAVQAIGANGVVLICKMTASQWLFGEREWHSGESTCLPSIWRFNSSPVPYMVDLVMVLALLQGFPSRFSSFSSSTTTNIYKFQFGQNRGPT